MKRTDEIVKSKTVKIKKEERGDREQEIINWEKIKEKNNLHRHILVRITYHR